MVQREKFQLNYIKMERQSGSFQGMRFTFQRQEDTLMVTLYPEPYCLEKTPDEKKKTASFPLTEEGLDQAVAWLNEEYEKQPSYWAKIHANRMKF